MSWEEGEAGLTVRLGGKQGLGAAGSVPASGPEVMDERKGTYKVDRCGLGEPLTRMWAVDWRRGGRGCGRQVRRLGRGL